MKIRETKNMIRCKSISKRSSRKLVILKEIQKKRRPMTASELFLKTGISDVVIRGLLKELKLEGLVRCVAMMSFTKSYCGNEHRCMAMHWEST